MKRLLIPLIGVLLLLLAFFYLKSGALDCSTEQTWRALAYGLGLIAAPPEEQIWVVVWHFRLPRLLAALVVGAGLSVCGAVLQGLTRNPLAEPGLLGVSSGASLAAVAAIVLGVPVSGLGAFALPVCAFVGALAAVIIAYQLSRRRSGPSVAVLILAGIGLNSLFGAVITLLIYAATPAQLKSLTFWAMGSLAHTNWQSLEAMAVFVVPCVMVLPAFAKTLNALYLGEMQALHIGIALKTTKRIIIIATALIAGACTAFTGPIGFVGLVVPHIVMLLVGGDYTRALPLSALMGATLLVLADLVARLWSFPAELPTGVVTALVGTPVFLWLVLKTQRQ